MGKMKSLEEKIIYRVASQLKTKKENVKPESILQDLGADSLDGVEIILDLEDKFNISIDDKAVDSLNTVQDIIDIVKKLVKGKKS